MSRDFYIVLHIAALAQLFAAVGGLALAAHASAEAAAKIRRLALAAHGVALLVILVAGFGLQAKGGYALTDGWFLGKLALWLLFGGIAAIPARKPHLAVPVFFAMPVLAAIGAWLAVFKPF